MSFSGFLVLVGFGKWRVRMHYAAGNGSRNNRKKTGELRTLACQCGTLREAIVGLMSPLL